MGFWGDVGNFFVGGKATEGLNTQGANSQYAQDFLRNQLGGAGGRQAPMSEAAQLGQAAQLNGGPQDQIRQQQQQQAGFLQGIMGGQQAGAGELAVNRQTGQGLAQQASMARMGRGQNAALMARNAARNSADIGLAGAGQAAQAQMQDQQGAAGQLGQMLGGMRGQDIDLAGQNANLQQQRMLQQGQFQQQTGLANQDARLRQTGMNDAAQQAYMAQLLGMDAQTFQNEMMKRGLAAQDKGALPGLIQAGASIGAAAASDRNLKTDIRDARADVDAMMDALEPFSYRYRDEKHGTGERVGIMTQDLERSEMGREMVVELPDGEGKGFDIVRGISAALAGIARLNERLKQIEERLG